MDTKRNVVSWSYLIAWFILACIGVVVGFTVFFIIMSIMGGGGRSIPLVATSLLITCCFGTVTGAAQWFILRQYSQQAVGWIWFTLLGFLVCSPIVISYGGGFGPSIQYHLVFYMTIIVGAILGILQWLAIRRKVKWSSVWVGVSFASWFLAGLIGTGLKALSLQTGPILFWIGLFSAGIILSGIGMIWVFNIKAEPTSMEAISPHRPTWKSIVRLPSTQLGWWSIALALAYVILLLIPLAISGKELLGQTGILWIIRLKELCGWAVGITGLIAVVEKREHSVVVWIAMLPAASSLVSMLLNVINMMVMMWK
jgi:hypothetical protein